MRRLKSMFSPLKFAADAVLEINPEVVCEGRSLPRAAAPKGQPPIAGGDQRERACEMCCISQEKPDEAHRAKSENPRLCRYGAQAL